MRVHAVSVNPVDTKVRSPKDKTESSPRVLGWDAAGVVEAVGPEVKHFKRGDAVYYAGSITRPGCDSELHLVDERIVGLKPRSLDFAQAAALPLTALTAYEALFDRLAIDPGGKHAGRTLLIINGAGGVGSIAIQLAKLAGLRVSPRPRAPSRSSGAATDGRRPRHQPPRGHPQAAEGAGERGGGLHLQHGGHGGLLGHDGGGDQALRAHRVHRRVGGSR